MAIKLKLSKTQIQYLAAGIVVAGALGFVYVKFFWMPLSKRILDLESKIAEVTAKIDKARAVADRLPRLQKELADLYKQAADMEMQLPKSKSVPDILVTLTNLAEKYGVEISAFSPGSKKEQQYFTEWGYPISLQGSFHNIGRFFAAFALEQRIYNIQNVGYGAPNEAGRMPLSFILIAYQYKG